VITQERREDKELPKNTYMKFFYVKELPKNMYFVISVPLYPKELITRGKTFLAWGEGEREIDAQKSGTSSFTKRQNTTTC
jgi:hypothetical protein